MVVLSTRIAGGAGGGFSQVKAGYGITFLVLSVPSGEASLRLMARSTNMTATGVEELHIYCMISGKSRDS